MDNNQSVYLLQKQIWNSLTADQHQLKQFLSKIKKANSEKKADLIKQFEKKIRSSQNKVTQRQQSIPKITIPESLPVLIPAFFVKTGLPERKLNFPSRNSAPFSCVILTSPKSNFALETIAITGFSECAST